MAGRVLLLAIALFQISTAAAVCPVTVETAAPEAPAPGERLYLLGKWLPEKMDNVFLFKKGSEEIPLPAEELSGDLAVVFLSDLLSPGDWELYGDCFQEPRQGESPWSPIPVRIGAPVSSDVSGEILQTRGAELWRQKKVEASYQLHRQALRIHEKGYDLLGRGKSLYWLALLERHRRRHGAARAFSEAGALFFERLLESFPKGSREHALRPYANLLYGLFRDRLEAGKKQEALAAAERRLKVYEELGDLRGQALSWTHFADWARRYDDPEVEREALEEARKLYREAGDAGAAKRIAGKLELARRPRPPRSERARPRPAEAGRLSEFDPDAFFDSLDAFAGVLDERLEGASVKEALHALANLVLLVLLLATLKAKLSGWGPEPPDSPFSRQ